MAETVVATASCVYDLDVALHVVAVDEAWAGFAVANGAPDLQPPRCLGKSVLGAIADPTTALVYRRLFDRVQLRAEPVRFGIRCDSPVQRRFLEFEIGPRPGGFRVHSTVVRTEPRHAQELLTSGRFDDGTVLQMCGWCKRVDVAGEWVEVEEAVRRLSLFDRDVLPRVAHTMCEECYSGLSHLTRLP
jgi:hypothetical protein